MQTLRVFAQQRAAYAENEKYPGCQRQHLVPENRQVVDFHSHPTGHENAGQKRRAQTQDKQPVRLLLY